MNHGTLFGIGVGPGDPQLMTLKALKTILSCDAVAIPAKDPARCTAYKIACGADPAIGQKPLLAVDMPMTKDAAVLAAAYEAGARLVAEQLTAGKNVAFLTLGDPSVYSTYFYIHEKIRKMGFATEIIPGVPSFCAAAAALQEPLCENSTELHIIPGTYNPAEGLDYPGTRILMKNNLAETKAALKERGLSAALVENCGMENQRLIAASEELPDKSGYFTVLIVKEQK
ncbi:MAG: precorrin-2 C(20)-methyltransferase [Firmicutes bacterium]|nr:precorrin-2 C(20)-methyltransferase [Bacillota bacterium]